MQYAFDIFDAHEEQLSKRLLDFLKSKDNVSIIGDCNHESKKRVCTIAFVVKGQNSAELNEKVHPHKIGIKTGDFYAKGITKKLGLNEQGGVIRVSMAHYNTMEEMERLINILDTLI